VKVEPFMPPVFGYSRIANFEVYSYPRGATYVMGLALLLLGVALLIAWREARHVERTAVAA
jgi:uncharacterized membrane protein